MILYLIVRQLVQQSSVSCVSLGLASPWLPCFQYVPPVELPGLERALGALVPVVEGLGGQVVVLPAAQDVPGRRCVEGMFGATLPGALVQVVSVVLVAVVVVVLGGETGVGKKSGLETTGC